MKGNIFHISVNHRYNPIFGIIREEHHNHTHLKVRLHEIFIYLKWFGLTNPSALLINALKYFRFWFQIRWGIWISCIPCILSLLTYVYVDSFSVFLLYEQIHSAYSQCTNRQFAYSENTYTQQSSVWRSTSSCVFSVYVQIHPMFSKYTKRIIPRILSICTVSFPIFVWCVNKILNIWNAIIFFTAIKALSFQK